MKEEELEQEVVKKGGVEERSTEEQLKAPKRFPSSYEPFFSKRNPQEIVDRTIKLDDLRKRKQVPNAVEELEVLIEAVVVNGRNMSRVVTTFQQDNDPNFAGAYVWIKGYRTDNALADYDENKPENDKDDNAPEVNQTGADATLPYERLATISRSPYTTYLENTAEKIIIGVEAYNQDGIGSGLDKMPIQTVELLA